MGRLVGIVLFVAALYFASNYVSSGPIGPAESAEATRTAPQRAGDSVRKSFAEGTSRLEKLLPE